MFEPTEEELAMAEAVLFGDEHLEAPCEVCGNPIYPLEPDAHEAYCEECGCVQPVINPLTEMGLPL